MVFLEQVLFYANFTMKISAWCSCLSGLVQTIIFVEVNKGPNQWLRRLCTKWCSSRLMFTHWTDSCSCKRFDQFPRENLISGLVCMRLNPLIHIHTHIKIKRDCSLHTSVITLLYKGGCSLKTRCPAELPKLLKLEQKLTRDQHKLGQN